MALLSYAVAVAPAVVDERTHVTDTNEVSLIGVG